MLSICSMLLKSNCVGLSALCGAHSLWNLCGLRVRHCPTVHRRSGPLRLARRTRLVRSARLHHRYRMHYTTDATLSVFTIHQNSRFLRSLRDSARVSLGRAARARVSCAGRRGDRGDRRVLCVNACARDAAMAPESQAQERRPPRAPLSANQSIRRRGRGASHALHLKLIHISAICIIFIYSVLYEYILLTVYMYEG